MDILFSAILAATPSPSVDPANTYFSPGTVGFLAVFAMASGAIALIFDMVRRVRRVRYRAEIEERLDAESVEKPAAPAKPARPAPPAKPKRD
ncbi:MAG: hypothetical protein RIS82_862 [Actinomycetota bacterium]